jgi:hypothetical protein
MLPFACFAPQFLAYATPALFEIIISCGNGIVQATDLIEVTDSFEGCLEGIIIDIMRAPVCC